MEGLQKAAEIILTSTGDSITRESTLETPKRFERFVQEFFKREEFRFTTFEAPSRDLVAVMDIDFASFCAHHLLPFYGKAYIGYVPNKRVAGLSKVVRTVDYFSRRFTMQEEITNDVAKYLSEKLDPLGVVVVLKATHTCMTLRGVRKPGSYTTTVALRGIFEHNPTLKSEFLSLIPK